MDTIPAAVVSLKSWLVALSLGTFGAFTFAEVLSFKISGSGLFSPTLLTNVYKPEGKGPFPVVVLNHGWGTELIPADQRQYLPTMVAAEFMRRNYVVVVPMRRGFAGSGGAAIGYQECRLPGFKNASVEDLGAVVSWVKTQPWASTNSMLMVGQSAGGLATLAYAGHSDPGFKLFVNFAGGLRGSPACNWQSELQARVAEYGRDTASRVVWIYGSNDSFFSTDLYRAMFKAYAATNTNSVLHEIGNFKSDSHMVFGDFDGYPLWKNVMWSEMSKAGLPTAEVNLAYGRPPEMKRPPPSGYARIEESDKIPHVSDGAKGAYTSQFLRMKLPRAYAISAEGHWAWADQGEDAPFRALSACEAQAGAGACRLYAIDNDVVWPRN